MASEEFVQILRNSGTFRRANNVERQKLLEDMGLPALDAAQIMIDLAREAPGGPSVMDPPASFLTRTARGLGRMGLEAGPATGGALVGGALAPLVKLPREFGEAVGGATGEGLRQLMTEAPFNLEQIMGAALVPGAARGAAPIVRGTLSRAGLPSRAADLGATRIPPEALRPIAKRMPGTAGAFADIAQETVEGIPDRIRAAIDRLVGTAVPREELMEAGLTAPGRVPLARTEAAVADVRAKDILPGFPLDINEKVLNPLTNFLEASAAEGGKSLRELNTLRRTVGEFYGGLKTGGPQRDAAQKLVAGVLEDLDVAITAGAPGARSLRQGLDKARLEFASRDFENLLEDTGFGLIRQGERQPVFKLNRVLTELEKVRRDRPSNAMRLFKGAFKGPAGEQELNDIIDLVGQLNETVIALPPPRGVQAGSSQNLVAGAAGAALAPAVGLSPAMGAAAGIGTKNILTRLLMSKDGRAALRFALTEGTELDLLAVLGTFLGNLVSQDLLEGGPLLQRFEGARLSNP